MKKRLSDKNRNAIMKLFEKGFKAKEIAEITKFSQSIIYYIRSFDKWAKEGNVAELEKHKVGFETTYQWACEKYGVKTEETAPTKFKVGDRVRAIDNIYAVTNKRNGYEGLVVDVYYDGEEEVIELQTLKCETRAAFEVIKVFARHFELITDTPVATLETTTSTDLQETNQLLRQLLEEIKAIRGVL